jgi:alpha-glucosidase (family GH31 glycosyl hydrolase)
MIDVKIKWKTKTFTLSEPNLKYKNRWKRQNIQGFVVKNKTNLPYILDFGEFYCGIVDLSNPAAFNWYKGKTQHCDL